MARCGHLKKSTARVLKKSLPWYGVWGRSCHSHPVGHIPPLRAKPKTKALKSNEGVYFLLVPEGLPFLLLTGWFVVHGSRFFMANTQGAPGWAQAPCVLFLVATLLAACLVGGLAAVWVCGCGCGRVLPIVGGCGWLLAALPAGWFLWLGGGLMRARNFCFNPVFRRPTPDSLFGFNLHCSTPCVK